MHEASVSRDAQSSHPGGLEPPSCAPLSSQEGWEGQSEEGKGYYTSERGAYGRRSELS